MTILEEISKEENKGSDELKTSFYKKRHENFRDNILSRFGKYKAAEISEDCIRYDYFHAAVQLGSVFERPLLEAWDGVNTYNYDSDDLVLEYPHPDKRYEGKKIDCVVMQLDAVASASGKDIYKPVDAVELKFFPEIKSEGTAKTQHIASLIADFQRLRDAKKLGTRLVVLVAMNAMITYIENPANGFSALFSDDMCKIPVNMQEQTTFRKEFEKRTYKGIKLTPYTIERLFFDRRRLESGPNKDKEIVIAIYKIK